MEIEQEPLLLDITRYFKNDESVYAYPYLYTSNRGNDIIHYHNFYELVIVKSGSGKHITKDGSYTIRPGDAFLIRSGDRHGYCDLRQLELINLLYRPEKLQFLLDELRTTDGYNFFFETDPDFAGKFRFKERLSLMPETMLKIDELTRQMVYEQSGNNSAGALMVKVLFIQLITLICRNFETYQLPFGEVGEITEIIRYLERHCREKISLQLLAKRFGKSVSSLSRLFQNSLNTSPMAYLIRLRLTKAAGELLSSSASIYEISVKYGFHDSNYFSKMFSRQFGISPRSYRQKHSSHQK